MAMFTDVETETRFADLVSDLSLFDDGELTDRFRELELVQRRATAEMAAIAGEVDRRGAYRDDGHRALTGWLRAHGNYAPGTVTRTKRLARLFGDCPEVADDLYAGRIGVDQATELGRARANPRCGDRLHDSVGVLLDHGQRFGYADFVACVKRWETLADLDGAHQDRGEAVRARRAAVIAGVDGVDITASGGTGLQAAEMAAILEAFVEAEFQRDLAERRQRCGDDAEGAELVRTDAQRRFDALMAIFRTANTSPGDDTPAVATVNIVCDQYIFESALARHGLADEPRDLPQPGPVRTRCETTSGTPLLPDDVVVAALGGWVRRVLTDSASVVVDLGHRRRCFTGAAAEAARLLVTSCEQDGCMVPEAWAQIDHLREWGDGGRTDQDNAGIDCGHHNRFKHRRGLRTRRDRYGKLHTQRPDGTWITPVGCDPPDEYDFQTDADIDELARQRVRNLSTGS
jgi:hypothetical protein